jgi:integrase
VGVLVTGQYSQYFTNFVDFCKENGLPTELGPNTDTALADYFDVLYLQGYGPGEGEKTLAALQFMDVRFKNRGSLAALRAVRALKGWRKAAPPGSRLPLPLLLVQGLVMALHFMGKPDVGLYVAMLFVTYMRPSEGLALRGRDVVPAVSESAYPHTVVIIRRSEEAKPDKVGVFDDTVAFDQSYFKMVEKKLLARARVRDRLQPLWDFDLEEANKAVNAAARRVGFGKTISVYQCRHGGASHDMASGERQRDAVKARGRWQTEGSLRRYVKTGKVQALLTGLDLNAMQYLRQSARLVDDVYLGVRPAVQPPRA